MRRWILAGASCLVATYVAAAESSQSEKKPWTLTLDERIALRTDPELARQRVGRGERVHAASASDAKAQPWVDEFTGKDHPELFLPHEVFRELMRLTFQGPPRARQVMHEGLMPEVKRHGLPADFWKRLESISAIHVADLWAEKDLLATARPQSARARQRGEQALALKQVDVCRSRSDALTAARREFGRERFDRFLYEGIAVNMFHASDRLPDAEVLRKGEGGCR